jgi:putative nucleotidyltransferase with HDIG domain
MLGVTRKSPRLARWDGRRRSSRSDALDLAGVGRPGTLARLLVAAAACLVLTLLVDGDGPPFAYRLGQTAGREVRARVAFAVVNEYETARRDNAAAPDAPPADPVTDRIPAGTVLLRRDTPISADVLSVLRAEHRAYRADLPAGRGWGHRAAVLLAVGLLVGAVGVYAVRFQPAVVASLRATAGVALLCVGTVAAAVAVDRPPWHAGPAPLAFTAMVLTLAYNPPFALFLSVCLSILFALVQGTDLGPLLVALGGLATAVLLLGRVRGRTRPAAVGLAAGLAFAGMTAAAHLLAGQPVRFLLLDAGRNLGCGLLAGFVLTGVLPWVERLFGVVTDYTLLELADNAHPLLEELIRRAPGTYTHSVTVATLAEAAAEAIGADGLLVRVGAYYHDVGKMLKPHYFAENQTGANRHDELEPSLSTLVITGHVKDGAALAERYGLPRPVTDFIRQHHGTTLVEYFYREAVRLHGPDVRRTDDLEPAFRYPGPKPQTREAGVLMLADAAESASRALPVPAPNALRKLVADLSRKRLLDGQFDESGLTLAELRAVEESLTNGLIAVFHARVRYGDEPAARAA